MIYLVVLLALGGIVAIIANRFQSSTVDDRTAVAAPSCETCSGNDERCMSDCLLEASLRQPEYFDDEHLDAFIGRRDDDFSDEEIEQFRDVMMTMPAAEVADWTRSLQLRGINLPSSLRDEAIMLIDDSR